MAALLDAAGTWGRRAGIDDLRRDEERVQLVEQLETLNDALEARVGSRTSELSRTLRERETLLREKTSLLQEVHHRVKNNLQRVSSLLDLQAKQIEDEDARAIFLVTQGWVRSIALLHESLHQSDDLGLIDMQQYVDKLVDTPKRTFGPSATLVRDLSVQLRGNAELASTRGARCAVRFPLPRPKIGERS